MKIIMEKTTEGEDQIRYIPETLQDLVELKKLDKEKKLDIRDSFADDPKAFGKDIDFIEEEI